MPLECWMVVLGPWYLCINVVMFPYDSSREMVLQSWAVVAVDCNPAEAPLMMDDGLRPLVPLATLKMISSFQPNKDFATCSEIRISTVRSHEGLN